MRGLSGISQGQHKGRETGGAPDTRPIFPVGSSLRSQMARQSEVSLSHTALREIRLARGRGLQQSPQSAPPGICQTLNLCVGAGG